MLRSLVREHSVSVSQLIQPLFVCAEPSSQIDQMPGIWRHDRDSLFREIEACLSLGIGLFALFPVISADLKDSSGKESLNPEGLIPRVLSQLKARFPQAQFIADLALDPYTSHGHDGLLDPQTGVIFNDPTVRVLGRMAVMLAQAGADILAPSDMMDGRVGFIRQSLDLAGLQDKLILAYAAKFASALYGPFRDALSSAPGQGDKKSYQLDPANSLEAELELDLDSAEGADLLLVKPGLFYLDIIARAKKTQKKPILAYSVSGEYSMIEFAAQAGCLDKKKVVSEAFVSLRRAGASGIISYHAKEYASWLKAGLLG